MRWELIGHETASREWDKNLIQLKEYNVYQSFGWAESRKFLGWTPLRLMAFSDDNQIVAMFQGLVRKYFNVSLFFAQGAPAGDVKILDKDFKKAISSFLGAKHWFCRIYAHHLYEEDQALFLKNNNWVVSKYIAQSGLSMIMDLSKSKDEIFSAFSKNWRHNLRRSLNENLTVEKWIDPSLDEVQKVFASMEGVKKLKSIFSNDELHAIFNYLGKDIILYRCLDANNEVFALRGCVITGDRAVDFFAATSETGRKTYASYILFWTLIQDCIERKIKTYDLNGIDPAQGLGVYNFKKGTGAVPVKYLGAWDCASSEIIRRVVNFIYNVRKQIRGY
ncbi:MAG: peptidoglycan bridge formation glycyltransferase FemA/FemB family protein [Candidatus Omnitrophica bacterium]|nr:peptidoglycan bridge formation glycyltransferase FemA/FemB family protein [Candidatus Omnitrophota bacterium]